MQVRLLGPVDILAEGAPRPVSGLRRKAVLATLALHAGEIVSTGGLLAAAWGEDGAPVVNTLQTHLSCLRDLLGSRTAILARPPGYLLDLGHDEIDVRQAERMFREGTQPASPVGDRVRRLAGALALWRDRSLADVTGLAWLEAQAARLDALRVEVTRALLEARLEAGEHARVVPELERMAAAHPLDEQVTAQLMLALYRSRR